MRKDREARRAYCAKVRSEKAAIDKARLELTAGWRDMTKQANEAGKEINTRLEALAIEKRAPLTEWEDAEKAREAEVDTIIDMFQSERFVPMVEASAHIREGRFAVADIAIDPDSLPYPADE